MKNALEIASILEEFDMHYDKEIINIHALESGYLFECYDHQSYLYSFLKEDFIKL